MGSKVYESGLSGGMKTVILENEYVVVTILPDKGADIYSIQYKPRNYMDVLWKAPWGPFKPGLSSQVGNSEHKWMDYYPGGWQTMFPNAGAESTYKGATHGFHGEANSIPWEYEIVSGRENGSSIMGHKEDSSEGVRTVKVRLFTKLARSPFRISRTFTLHDGQPCLQVEEEIHNAGEEPMEYVWGQHIAYGAPFLNGSCRLQVPAGKIVSDVHTSSPYHRLSYGEVYNWPLVPSSVGSIMDFSQIPADTERAVDMAYLSELSEGWYALHNEEMNLSVGVGWELEDYPYIWLWQEFRGSFGYPFYGRCYVMGVEPCSTPTGNGLAESVEGGFAKSLTPGESKRTKYSMVFFEGNKEISGITSGGEVV